MWALGYNLESALFSDEPIHLVDKDKNKVDEKHGRQKRRRTIAVWSGLVKAIECGQTLLDVIFISGSPSEAWKMLSCMTADETSDITQDKMRLLKVFPVAYLLNDVRFRC